MNTKNWMRHLAWGVLGLVSQQAYSQASQADNNGGFGSFLGWNAGANQVLEVKNEADQSIDLYTSNIRRFRLLPNGGYLGLGSFAFIPAPGYALLSPNVNQFYTNGAPGPYSLLHLAAATDNAQQQSFRPWMQTGITITGNADHNYFGQKASSLDFTDVVLHWSDNPGKTLKDRMRFIFTSAYSGAATGSGSVEGLEGMRLFPVNENSIHIGLGDFYAANLADPSITEPTERLDIVDGRVRIRALPEPAGEVTASYKVMVVDDSPAPSAERGVVKWIDPADLPPTGGGGGADCDWTVLNPNTSGSTTVHHVYTAVGTNDLCPDESDNVGIGIVNPTAKLHVYRQVNSGAGNIGGRFHMTGSDGNKRSLFGLADGGGSEHCGVRGESSNGTSRNYGVHGLATTESDVSNTENYGLFGEAVVASGATNSRNTGSRSEGRVTGTATNNHAVFGRADVAGSSASVSDNHGVYAEARAYNFGTVGNNYGVKAEAITYGNGSSGTNYGIHAKATGGAVNWAGYFVGNVHATGNVTWSSDEMLKSEIEPLEHAMEIIGSLRPKRYNFRTEEFAQLNLPQGNRMGLIAQDVQQVLPVLVQPVSHPEEYDAETGVTHPGVDYLSLNYAELIPLLIAGMQEQQAELEEQRAANVQLMERLEDVDRRLGDLQAAFANCCAAHGNDADQRSGSIDNSQLSDPASERLLTIAPNPFTDRTTVSYTLERGGRAQLLVNSSDGKHLQVLEEGVRSEGQYNYTWSTAHLAPGVYYVTLLLDGEPLVKRAVKVQ